MMNSTRRQVERELRKAAVSQGPRSSKRSHSLLALLPAALLLMRGFVTPVLAEQLKIIDSQGKTRSAAELNSGDMAAVKVELKSSTPGSNLGGVSVSLVDSSTKKAVQTTKSDGTGLAQFLDVAAGTYQVVPSDASSKIEISDVQINKGVSSRQGSLSAQDSSRVVNRALYVSGASAVAGVLGVALASQGSGGSSTESALASGALGNSSSVAALNAGGTSGAGALSTSALVEAATVPNPGTISPPPTTITNNPVPKEPGLGGPAPGDEVLSGTTPVAPIPQNPPTISAE